MQNFITKEQLEKYDAIKGRFIEKIDEFPAQAENRIYAKFHEYEKTTTETKTPIDLVGSYFKLVSTGKYVIRDLYAVTYNGNPIKSIFISDFNVSLYANEDFSGLYADTLNSQTQYEWNITETVEHFDYFVGNKEENTFVQLANYEQLEDFFIRKTEKGSAGGVATLDADGRIPIEQMNVKSLRLIGTYDCSSGVFPSTVNRVEGDYYRVSVGGTLTEMRNDIIIKANEAISLFEKNLINEAITAGLQVYIDIEGVKTAIVSVDTNKIILENSEIPLPQDSDVRLYADTEFPFSWTFDVNDLIVFNSQGEWQKLKSQDSVTSVNGKTGDVKTYGDNTPIETPTSTSDTRTIKEYIEATAEVKVDGLAKDENDNINSIAVIEADVKPSAPLNKVYKVGDKVYAKDTELVTEVCGKSGKVTPDYIRTGTDTANIAEVVTSGTSAAEKKVEINVNGNAKIDVTDKKIEESVETASTKILKNGDVLQILQSILANGKEAQISLKSDGTATITADLSQILSKNTENKIKVKDDVILLEAGDLVDEGSTKSSLEITKNGVEFQWAQAMDEGANNNSIKTSQNSVSLFSEYMGSNDHISRLHLSGSDVEVSAFSENGNAEISLTADDIYVSGRVHREWELLYSSYYLGNGDRHYFNLPTLDDYDEICLYLTDDNEDNPYLQFMKILPVAMLKDYCRYIYEGDGFIELLNRYSLVNGSLKNNKIYLKMYLEQDFGNCVLQWQEGSFNASGQIFKVFGR